MKPLGLYLHIPFCKSKCRYCDFCSYPNRAQADMESYVKAMLRELSQWSRSCEDCVVDTVYLGGGTPTLLPPSLLQELLECVVRLYRVSDHAEITAECNPATVTGAYLEQMRGAGFNRLSIGLQSVHPNELRRLGRLHSFRDFQNTWELALRAGFSNLSADVMFGIPEQTEESFAQTLEQVTALKPKHLSAYALSVEEGTAFGRMGEERLDLPSEDAVRNMYLNMVSQLSSKGLLRYEISNFAEVGYESRHNLKYWNCQPYLGFGPAAHSDFGGARFGNGRNLEGFLRGDSIVEEHSVPSEADRRNERIMLGMRLEEGVDLEELANCFGVNEARRLEAALRPYAAAGFAVIGEGRARLTTEGMLVSNTILSELLDFENV